MMSKSNEIKELKIELNNISNQDIARIHKLLETLALIEYESYKMQS
jgi:hypothetical protein